MPIAGDHQHIRSREDFLSPQQFLWPGATAIAGRDAMLAQRASRKNQRWNPKHSVGSKAGRFTKTAGNAKSYVSNSTSSPSIAPIERLRHQGRQTECEESMEHRTIGVGGLSRQDRGRQSLAGTWRVIQTPQHRPAATPAFMLPNIISMPTLLSFFANMEPLNSRYPFRTRLAFPTFGFFASCYN